MHDEVSGPSGSAESRQLRAELQSVNQQRSQLDEQLAGFHSQKLAWEKERDSSSIRERELENRCRELNDKLSAQEQDLLVEKQNAIKILGQMEVLRQQKDRLEKELNATDIIDKHPPEIAVTELVQQLTAARNQLEEAREQAQQFSRLEQLFSSANGELDRERTMREEAEDTLRKAQEEKKTNKTKISELESELKAAITSREEAQTRVTQLEDALREANQKLRQKQMAADIETQLQRPPSADNEIVRKLKSRNRIPERQLQAKQAQYVVFRMLQASVENIQAGTMPLGKIEIITSTAVISINIPQHDIPRHEARSSPFALEEQSPNRSPVDGQDFAEICIQRVLNLIQKANQVEPWALYFDHQKVMWSNWTAQCIKEAMEGNLMCTAGPEALLRSTKGRKDPDNLEWTTDTHADKLIALWDSLSLWIQRKEHSRKRQETEAERRRKRPIVRGQSLEREVYEGEQEEQAVGSSQPDERKERALALWRPDRRGVP